MKKLVILMAILVGINACTPVEKPTEDLVVIDSTSVAVDSINKVDSTEAANLMKLMGDTLK